jgi:hypothetical protein
MAYLLGSIPPSGQHDGHNCVIGFDKLDDVNEGAGDHVERDSCHRLRGWDPGLLHVANVEPMMAVR